MDCTIELPCLEEVKTELLFTETKMEEVLLRLWDLGFKSDRMRAD